MHPPIGITICQHVFDDGLFTSLSPIQRLHAAKKRLPATDDVNPSCSGEPLSVHSVGHAWFLHHDESSLCLKSGNEIEVFESLQGVMKSPDASITLFAYHHGRWKDECFADQLSHRRTKRRRPFDHPRSAFKHLASLIYPVKVTMNQDDIGLRVQDSHLILDFGWVPHVILIEESDVFTTRQLHTDISCCALT